MGHSRPSVAHSILAPVDDGRRCLAEALGTFVLVLATVGATVVSGSLVGVAVTTWLGLELFRARPATA